MASVNNSEEMNSWFETHGNQVFDNWNTDAQHAQIPVRCQSFPLGDARQPFKAHISPSQENADRLLNIPQIQPTSNVAKSILSDEIIAPRSSSKNTLTASNLGNIEANATYLQIMAVMPIQHILGSYTYLDGLGDSSLGGTDLVRKVCKWLNKTPKSTEQRSSRMSPLTAGEQLVRSTFLAIDAYQKEKEQVVTIREYYRRQQNAECVNPRERDLRVVALCEIGRNKPSTGRPDKNEGMNETARREHSHFTCPGLKIKGPRQPPKWAIPYIPDPHEYPIEPVPKTKKWVNPYLEQVSQGEDLMDSHSKGRKSTNESDGQRKRLPLNTKEKGRKSSRELTSAEWVALGE